MTPTQSAHDKLIAAAQARKNLQDAGISWPPKPWQRVEIANADFDGNPEFQLFGTVLQRDGSCTLVLPDFQTPTPTAPREFYWDNELRPVLDDKQPGWVPFAIWKQYLYDPTSPQKLMLKLNDERESWIFDVWPKLRPPRFVYFLQLGHPHGQYNEFQIAAVRPDDDE